MLSKISINIIVWMTEVWISNFLLYVIIKCNDKKTYMYDLHKAGAPDTLSARKEVFNQLHNILPMNTQHFRYFKMWGKRKGWQALRIEPRTPDPCSQCSATELQEDNHQPLQSSVCTAQVVLKYLSHTAGSHSACAVWTPLGIDWKILSIRKESMLGVFLTPNACLMMEMKRF